MGIRIITRLAVVAALTGALAWVMVPLPFSPVPVSGQTFGVMLAGAFLVPRAAGLSQLVYVGLGLVGLPVFAGGGSGIGVLVGPTGGYLWGFILSAYVMAWLLQHFGRSRRVLWLTVSAGTLIIYLPGVVQLSLVSGRSLTEAAVVGVLPFLAGDVVKAVIAGALIERAQKLVFVQCLPQDERTWRDSIESSNDHV